MDMLVRLYDLKPDATLDKRMVEQGVTIRRALVPELKALCDWIEPRFGSGWASEATAAIMRQPVTCFIAHKGPDILGFACHEATMKGFFGPTGVDETARGKGIGQALLLATLFDMLDQGYAYAVIGGVGPTEFYRRSVGAMEIEGSDPGIYRHMIPSAAPDGMAH